MNKYKVILSFCLCVLLVSSCSTTKNLPDGQQLYMRQKKMKVENQSKTATGEAAMTELEAALAKAPNNSLLGSSTMKMPLPPIGLYVYNAYVNSQKGLGKLIFKKLASKPVFISTVNPKIRAKAATNILHDYGFFNGTVDYEVLTDPKNAKKAKIKFFVDMKNPYIIDTIMYEHFTPETKDFILRAQRMALLHKGDQFNVTNLDAERQRISTLLRNRGYYYFRPDFIGFRADTTRVSGLVDLQIIPKPGLPPEAKKQYYIGDISVRLLGVNGEAPNDSLQYENIMIHYHDKLMVRPKVLWKRFRFKEGDIYSQMRSTRTQEQFAQLGVFRYSEMRFNPRDTVATNNILDLTVNSTFDMPYDSELELNVATKSNDYTGPGAAYSITKRNVFKGGETFTIRLKGSYEWQTGGSTGSMGKINSYEYGITASLNFPRVVFPRLGKKDYDFPATTKFSVNADEMNRAHYFKMLSFGGDATYTFQPTPVSKHSVTPFKLVFNTLLSTTAYFDSIMDSNRALGQSMQDQYVPSIRYTYTYDDSSVRRRRNHFWWQSSVASAGNIVSALYALGGKGFNEEKQLLGASLAQFVKATSEIRYTWNIDRNQSIATRLSAGIIYAYGGREIAPYNERFYVGGANSIRAFTVRSIGPGGYVPDPTDEYDYMDQNGDIKMEANIEYRFRIIKDLHGAIFLDAGNVWLIREDSDRPGGKFSLSKFGKEIALGTGTGLRYDLSYLVIRLDCGIGLHLPYDTSRSGYYNIPTFKDGLGIHLAIGYPF